VELIEAIRSGGASRLHALEQIFKNTQSRAKVIRFLKSKGCRNEDAEDLYQDAMIIFDRRITEGELLERASIENYIYGIVKLNWYNKFRSYNKEEDIVVVENQYLVEDVSIYYERKERSDVYVRVINLLGERCRQLLLLANQGFSTLEIAEKLALDNTTRVQKEK